LTAFEETASEELPHHVKGHKKQFSKRQLLIYWKQAWGNNGLLGKEIRLKKSCQYIREFDLKGIASAPASNGLAALLALRHLGGFAQTDRR